MVRGGEERVCEEKASNTRKLKGEGRSAVRAVYKLKCGLIRSKVRKGMVTFTTICSAKRVRREDGSWDLWRVKALDKEVASGVVAGDTEIARAEWDVNGVISDLEARGTCAFNVGVGMIVPEVVKTVRGSSECAAIYMSTWRQGRGKEHRRELEVSIVINGGDGTGGKILVKLIECSNCSWYGRRGCRSFSDDIDEFGKTSRGHATFVKAGGRGVRRAGPTTNEVWGITRVRFVEEVLKIIDGIEELMIDERDAER